LKLSHNQAVALMVLVTLLWSTAGVVTRHLEFARSFEVTFWRSLFTAVSLLILLPLFQGMQVLSQLRHNGKSFWLSGVCWGAMFTSFMLALTLTSVANVLVTMAMGPLFTALFARVVIGHRIPLRTWLAIMVAGAGIVYMFAEQLSEAHLLGTLLALCVPSAAAINWTIAQSAAMRGLNVDLVPAVLVGAVLSALFTLPWAYPFQASSHDLALLAGLGLTQLAVPCMLSLWCAKVLQAPEVSLLALLEIIFGIALAWWGANEVPSQTVLIGGVLVIGALFLNELFAWRERKAV
jgi:drug/metabolite transporter (DMT)-like permease